MSRSDAPVRVRPFRLAYLKRILEIERASFGADAYPEDMFRDLYRDCGGLFFVARRCGRIAGYMVTCAGRRTAEVVSIAVDPAFRRGGIGAALMTHTIAALRLAGIRRVTLSVRPKNRAAIAFYRGFGFRRAGRVARYYEDGEDALRMELHQ